MAASEDALAGVEMGVCVVVTAPGAAESGVVADFCGACGGLPSAQTSLLMMLEIIGILSLKMSVSDCQELSSVWRELE